MYVRVRKCVKGAKASLACFTLLSVFRIECSDLASSLTSYDTRAMGLLFVLITTEVGYVTVMHFGQLVRVQLPTSWCGSRLIMPDGVRDDHRMRTTESLTSDTS